MIQLVDFNPNEEKLNEIANYLIDKYDFSVKARSRQIDTDYRRWQDNYSGKPKEATRSTPFPNASNFVPQLIRMHTDILSARLCGIMFATKPFWKPKTYLQEALPHQSLDALSYWLEYISFNELELFEAVDTSIFSTAKCGTSILKAPWITEDFICYDGMGNISSVNKEGLQIFQVPFEDFYPWPITARNLKNVRIKFHRLRFTKEEIEWRKTFSKWNEKACDLLIGLPEEEGKEPKRETEQRGAGIDVTQDVSRPFHVVEAWCEYPSLDGRTQKLVVTFNPKQRGKLAILRSVYNYYKIGLDPFIDFRIMPRDDLFYGYSVPEILEQSQEEQAQIHNSRRDANTISNIPGWKKKLYANVPDPSSEWFPGKVFELDNMDDLEPLQFGGDYNSMIEEEQYLLQLTERYTGIQTPMQGFGAGAMEGKRGIYNSQGTLALLAEGNKRLDIFLKRFRFPFHRLGNLIFQSYKEFRKDAPELEAMGKYKEAFQQILQIEEPADFRGLFFDIGASDAGTNKELDRQNLLLMANTMASYYRQVMESATLFAQIPEGNPLRDIISSILSGARDLADRLLFTFDIGDRDRLLPDMQEILNGGAGREGAAQPPGMSPAEEPLNIGQVRDLSTRLAAIQGGGL